MPPPPPESAPVVTLSGGTKLARPLQAGVPVSIGQAKSASFRIPHPAVSPIHCHLLWEGGHVTLRDAGSAGGTLVNGEAVSTETQLRDGDRISVGPFLLLFSWETARVSSPLPSAATPQGTAQPSAASLPPPPAPSASSGVLQVIFRGQNVREIPLFAGLTLGNTGDADVLLQDPMLSGIQASIAAAPDGFIVHDMARSGSLVNGKYFDQHPLVMGDLLQFGDHHYFMFDGYALRPVRDGLGSGLQASGLDVPGSKGRLILQAASFDARPGQFVGIIGPSGAGKTTLLKALLGLKPLSAGSIHVDGVDIRQIDQPSRFFGYVPQQEIIHLELTARQALHFSAMLRLPMRTPAREVDKLIASLTDRLGLRQHLDTRAGQLSGGQLKRLSVCVELLGRPPLLFLDEPTSGLDPESETELMQQLQELSYTGCTVVCTTHLMENVYLMSSLEVVMAGRDDQGKATPGRTVFRGKPRLAKELFNVRTLSKLYHRLKEDQPGSWQKLYLQQTGHSLLEPVPLPPEPSRTTTSRHSEKRHWAVPVLLRRQWQILRADWKNLLLLAGQPILIAGLIALVATGENPSDKKLFLAAIAVLWLGCGNAAPELVRERSIFRREQFVGLRASTYLFSKFAFLGCLTALQAGLIFLILKWGGSGLDGAASWQFSGLMACAAAATGLGLLISAASRTSLQAVLMVPVLIIPQILFAGFVFPLKDWENHAVPRLVSRVFPSFAAQRVMDVSLVWNKKVEDASDYPTALNNLNTTLRPLSVLWNPHQATTVTIDESTLYAPPESGEPFGPRTFEWDPAKRNILTPRYVGSTMRDERPRLLRHATPAWQGLASLGAWALSSCAAAILLLRKKHDD